MTYKNYFKAIALFGGIVIGFSLINAICYYNNLFSIKIVDTIKIITMIVATLISGLYIGLKSKNKGYINGLILGLIIAIISLVVSLLARQKLTLISFISYLLLIIVSICSSIIGINRKK